MLLCEKSCVFFFYTDAWDRKQQVKPLLLTIKSNFKIEVLYLKTVVIKLQISCKWIALISVQ